MSTEGNASLYEFAPVDDRAVVASFDGGRSRDRADWQAGSQLKKQIIIRLDEDAIAYLDEISEEVGIPCQGLINLYLRDCAASHRKLDLNWK